MGEDIGFELLVVFGDSKFVHDNRPIVHVENSKIEMIVFWLFISLQNVIPDTGNP